MKTLRVWPAPQYPASRSYSGVAIRFEPEPDPIQDAERLATTIHDLAVEGRIALWCVVELLYQLKPHHWAAYAAHARIAPPCPATISLAIQSYKLRIGYQEPAPQPNHDTNFS